MVIDDEEGRRKKKRERVQVDEAPFVGKTLGSINTHTKKLDSQCYCAVISQGFQHSQRKLDGNEILWAKKC